MDRRARARELVAAALSAVEAELGSPCHALCPLQLGTCRDTLRGYLAELEQDALPPRKDRGEPLGHLVLDGWPFDVPLGPVVLQAERAWRTC